MSVEHRSKLHYLVVGRDPDDAEWDDERTYRIEHPECTRVPGSLSEPDFYYEEYQCAVEYEWAAESMSLFGGPEYWEPGCFKVGFRLVYWRDYFGEVDVELEVVES
jgi:hypothetical protein